MLITAFLITCTTLNIVFCISIFFKEKRNLSFLPVVFLAILAPVQGFSAQALAGSPDATMGLAFFKAYIFSSLLILLGILETVNAFFKPALTKSVLLTNNIEKRPMIFSVWPWRAAIGIAVLVGVFLPDYTVFRNPDRTAGFLLHHSYSAVCYVRLLLDLAILFTMENIFRYAEPFQRRKGKLCFISFALLSIFDAVFTLRIILYSTLTGNYILASVVIYGISLCIGLFGLMQYRISEKRIVISRAGIYSSLTLILAGVLMLALGLTVVIVQRMGIRFSYFEQFLAVFSALSFVIIAASSQWMRMRVTRFVNKHFYRRKYDYRDQFFRLHQTYMAGEHLQDSIDTLLENLTHSVGIGDVLVFLRNSQDGNFHLQATPGVNPLPASIIKGDSPLLKVFAGNETPCLFSNTQKTVTERERTAYSEPLVQETNMAAVFPIVHQKTLVGLLGIRNLRDKILDEEDIDLIRVFAVSIGNVYFRYRMLQERMEFKQFESFHHIAAFIIHDIKNQVATLSLLMKNADRNMGNPEFQKSLLLSVKSCSDNLQALIDKLSVPLGQKQSDVKVEDICAIVNEVISATGIRSMETVSLTVHLPGIRQALVDRMSLFFVLKNLIINAIEAMNGAGSLSLAVDHVSNLSAEFKQRFAIGEHLLAENGVYIHVQDSGIGMSRTFIETRLFRPFTSTKDKGVGIGLYQCKLLVEKMGGRLLCFPGRMPELNSVSYYNHQQKAQ